MEIMEDGLIRRIELLKPNIGVRIKNRLEEFVVDKNNSEELFIELCFCILVANNSVEKTKKVWEKIGKGFLNLSKAPSSLISSSQTKSTVRLSKHRRHCSSQCKNTKLPLAGQRIISTFLSLSLLRKIPSSRKARIPCQRRNWIDSCSRLTSNTLPKKKKSKL